MQAKTNELAAVLAYDLSLVDFDAVQRRRPRTASASAADDSNSIGWRGDSSRGRDRVDAGRTP